MPVILTASGRYFNFTQPDPLSIDVHDIATSLSRICRFTGHTTTPYSVAQHSVYVSYVVPKKYAFQGLMHDASEAYMSDMNSPLKQLLPEYKLIERRVEQAIMERFGLPFPLHPLIKKADLQMLVTERREFMPPPLPEYAATDAEAWAWTDDIEPLPWTLIAWTPEVARSKFLDRFKELTD